jgi:putative phosphonate metabolism protein
MHRYAVYVAPPPGALADATARWLGWDPASGQIFPPDTDLPFDQAQVTAAPRKYGFHGTLKAPFRLADGVDIAQLKTATDRLAASLPMVSVPLMKLSRLKGFLALIPAEPCAPLNQLAARVVMDLDPLRAPLNPAEFARRNPDSLSNRQRGYLDQFGYPYVLDELRFHLTLSDDLDPEPAVLVETHLKDLIVPHVETPFVISDLCLFGEDDKGRFHLIHRSPLCA